MYTTHTHAHTHTCTRTHTHTHTHTLDHIYMYTLYMRISENHNSLGCEQPSRPSC